MSQEKSTPAPLETDPGQQKDDNIDDLGRGDGGKQQDQPVDPARKDQKSPAGNSR